MARRRTAEAAQTLPESLTGTHSELLVAEQTDLNSNASATVANGPETIAATPTNESTAAAAHATEREPGDEPTRPQLPNPMSWITDTIAQVAFRTAREPYQAEILFGEGKPSPEARAIMKDAGFRWNPQYEAWTRPIGFTTAAQDREIGRRTATAVIKQIRQEVLWMNY